MNTRATAWVTHGDETLCVCDTTLNLARFLSQAVCVKMHGKFAKEVCTVYTTEGAAGVKAGTGRYAA